MEAASSNETWTQFKAHFKCATQHQCLQTRSLARVELTVNSPKWGFWTSPVRGDGLQTACGTPAVTCWSCQRFTLMNVLHTFTFGPANTHWCHFHFLRPPPHCGAAVVLLRVRQLLLLYNVDGVSSDHNQLSIKASEALSANHAQMLSSQAYKNKILSPIPPPQH